MRHMKFSLIALKSWKEILKLSPIRLNVEPLRYAINAPTENPLKEKSNDHRQVAT